jgi:hypothetical protein
MRLLRFDSDGFVSLASFDPTNAPQYAILSHTWGPDGEELNFSELRGRSASKEEIEMMKEKPGYQKIQFCGRQAAKDDLEYFWVDSCCIDKRSSAELSEAINSMFEWYKRAVKCYVFLQDVSTSQVEGAKVSSPEDIWVEAFQGSRWFTRGWTLQELLAPKRVEFFSKEGTYLGEKEGMSSMLSTITSIPVDALQGKPLSKFTSKERFSWVKNRQTRLQEDKAYALCGIFDVHMPPIYGEGEDHAMNRLRKEIKQVERTLLQSLRFDRIGSRHTSIKDAHNETCRWLLSSSEYLDWLDPDQLEEHHGFLWIKAGKSTIMKFAHGCVYQALEFSQERFRMRHLKGKTISPNYNRESTTCKVHKIRGALEPAKETVVIAFFFNARGATLEKSTEGLYRSLLVQLLERRAYLETVVSLLPFVTTELNDNYPWNIGILQQLLREVVIRVKSPVLCFIDALDECEEQQVRDMMSFLRQTSDHARKSGITFRACFASRHYPHISLDVGMELVLERQEGHSEDIAEYINAELRIGNSTAAQLIRKEVQRKASGVFMWVVLVVSILNKTSDRGQIHALQRKLSEIPADLNTLFRDMVTRDSENNDRLAVCVKWLLFAIRPMSPRECYFALLFELEPDTLKFDEEEIPYDAIERCLLDSSKGLAHITPWSRSGQFNNRPVEVLPTTASDLDQVSPPPSHPVVQFIHESVRDFLLDYGGFQIIDPDSSNNFDRQSHEHLARCCLHYMTSAVLLDSAMPVIRRTSESGLETSFQITSLNHYPLLEYSVLHVLDHTAKTRFRGTDGTDMTRAVSHFRIDEASSGQVNMTFVHVGNVTNPENEQLYEQNAQGYFALFVVESSVVLGIVCVTHDNKETVRMFVENNDRASFEADWRFRIRRGGNKYLISYMVECAAKEMIEALLRSGRFDVNVLDPDGKTPLDYAVKRGDNAIIKLLLKAGALNHRASDSTYDAVSEADFSPPDFIPLQTGVFPAHTDGFSLSPYTDFPPYTDFSSLEADSFSPETDSFPPQTDSFPPNTDGFLPHTNGFPPYTDVLPPETRVSPPARRFSPPATHVSQQEIYTSSVEERLSKYLREQGVLDTVSAKGNKTKRSKHSCALM